MASEVAPGGPPVNWQIEATADYHEPAVYAFGKPVQGLAGLLSFYHSLAITADSAASGFVPISAVPQRGRNTKLFAVGVLAPNLQIDDGQILDRSAVVGNLTGEARTDSAEEAIARADSEEFRVPREISLAGVKSLLRFEEIRYEAYQDEAGKWTIGVGHTGPEVKPGLVWTPEQVEAAFRSDLAKFESVVASAVTVPVTQGEFDAMVCLAFNIGPTFASSTLVKKLNARDRAGASAEFDAWNKVTVKGDMKVVSAGLVARRRIERQMFDRAALDSAQPVPVKADVDSAEFAGYGSQNANAYRRGLARQTDLAQIDYSTSQLSYRTALKDSLTQMQLTPPLRLLINPNSFSVKSQKVVSDGNWGRKGPIVEFWGDEHDKISGSGQVAAFYALDTMPHLGRGGPGLTRSARNVSLAWQNFQSLYLLYRNNGGMYLPDVNQRDRDVLLTAVGSVYIYYDGILYIGSFDSFNVREQDQKPFTVEYDFEFTVRATFLLDRPPEFNYGGAAAFAGGRAGLPTSSRRLVSAGLADVASSEDSVVDASDVQSVLERATDAVLDAGGTRS